MKICVILTTVSNLKDAKRLSLMAVSSKSSACVSIIPNVISIYRWKGKVQRDKEFLLIFKTSSKKVSSLRKIIKNSHPYQVPEIVVIKADASDEYSKWVLESTS